MKNPFTPTFGIVPPYLAGRNRVIAEMRRAFVDWEGNPNRSTILIGPRGSGKTAMLSYIGDCAKEEGWIVSDTVASKGMMDDLLQRTMDSASSVIYDKGRKKITGLSIANVIGVSWTNEKENRENWRTKITTLLRELNSKDIGLLITVDEVRGDVDEMIKLAAIYQLLIREGAKISLVMAGLPAHVGQLISDNSVSFLRRAAQKYLDNIPDLEILNALRLTIESGGKRIDEDALKSATKAVGGFAYMMQLVGYNIWEMSGNNAIIDVHDVSKGIKAAESEFKTGVLDNTYLELSKGDINFLNAMLEDKERSSISDIAKRIGKTPGYASTYKKRLLQAGIIREAPGRTFSFAMPGLRKYMEEIN